MGYEVRRANNNRNSPYRDIAATSDSRATHHISLAGVKLRVRAKIGSVTSAWAEYAAP